MGKINASASEAGVSSDNVSLPIWNYEGHKGGRPYEPDFFEYMINDICSAHSVDQSRIYITGHSNGSMMTQYLALTRPQWFAAAAPCSGILYMTGFEAALDTEEVINRPGIDIPIWMMGGTNEEWLLDGEPKNGNRTEKSMRAWWKLNDMPGETPQNYPERKVSAGRWNDWFFDKNRVPMLRYSSIEGMPHAVLPEQSRRIWPDFFSHLSRQADGDIIYE